MRRVIASDRGQLDRSPLDSMRVGMHMEYEKAGPEGIANAAAYTAVDQAKNEPERAHLSALAPQTQRRRTFSQQRQSTSAVCSSTTRRVTCSTRHNRERAIQKQSVFAARA